MFQRSVAGELTHRHARRRPRRRPRPGTRRRGGCCPRRRWPRTRSKADQSTAGSFHTAVRASIPASCQRGTQRAASRRGRSGNCGAGDGARRGRRRAAGRRSSPDGEVAGHLVAGRDLPHLGDLLGAAGLGPRAAGPEAAARRRVDRARAAPRSGRPTTAAPRGRAPPRRRAAPPCSGGPAPRRAGRTGRSRTGGPRYMTATRSLTFLTTARSCAMKRIVRLYSCLRSSSRLRIWACTETSRAETISSQTSSFGLSTSARAMLMRWHWPPENSRGAGDRRAGRGRCRPGRAWRWRVCRRSSLVPIFQMLSGSATMSLTRRRGLSDEIGSWKIICTCVRSVRRSPRLSAVSSVSPKRILPEVARSTWTMARPVVDLPQPDSPTRPSVSPWRMVKLMPATAWTVVLPWWKETWRSSTDSSGSVVPTAVGSTVGVGHAVTTSGCCGGPAGSAAVRGNQQA